MEQATLTRSEAWKDYVDDSYELYFVNYDDDLRNHYDLLQGCIEHNDLYGLDEKVYDFWDEPEEYYLQNIRNEMAKDDLEDVFDEHIDDIRDWIFEHDESDPTKGLLRNTGAVAVFYSLCECDCYWVEAPFMQPYMAEEPDTTAKKICKILHIADGSKQAKQVQSVCANASYGGELRIYFQSEIEDLISGESYPNGKNKDWKSIHFKGTFAVAVYNCTDGAGDYEFIDLDVELPFIRQNLRISETERYSIEHCFGQSADWLNSADAPSFSFEKPKKKTSIKKSVINEREKHFEEVFKAGGCSVDDGNFQRHRGVYYRNDFPCGYVCPNCGRIWYD